VCREQGIREAIEYPHPFVFNMNTFAANPGTIGSEAESPPPSAASRRTGLYVLLAKAFFFLASIFVGKMCVFQINNLIEMLIVQKALDPTLFPNDTYVNTLQYYPIPMWHWIYPLFQFGSEVNILLVLGLIQRLFVFWAAGRLALAVTNGNRLAEVSAWAIFAAGIDAIVGDGRVYPYYFEHSGVCIGFLMMAMAAFVDKKPKHFAIWIGFAGFFNLLYGLGGLFYFLVATAIVPEYRSSFKKWFLSGSASLIVMLPSLYYALQVFLRPKLPPDEFALMNRLNFPYHYFPSSWSLLQYIHLAVALAAMTCIALWAPLRKELRLVAALWTGLVVFFILVAYVGADVLEISFLISTMPSRLTDFWYAFAAVTMVAVFAVLVSRAKDLSTTVLGVGGILASIALWRFNWLENLSPGFFGYGAAVVLVAGIALRAKQISATRSLRIGAMGVLAILFVGESLLGYQSLIAAPGSDILQRPTGPQTAVYQWIKENTPKNARFLTHPMAKDFRARANRTPYFLMREASTLMWDQTYGKDWIRRLRLYNLKGDAADAKDYATFLDHVDFNYAFVSDRNAQAIGRYEKVDFWMISTSRPTKLPVVYEDKDFRVVRLR
jgi:hypothetical protein